MEFSFDRSNESRARNSTTGTSSENQSSGSQEARMQNNQDGVDTSNIANERLRKAIERNRSRQAERMKNQPQPPTVAQANSKQEEVVLETNQASFFDKPSSSANRLKARAQERIHEQVATSSAVVTRRTVANSQESDFTPAKRTAKKVASQVSYSTTSSRKKSKSLNPKLLTYLVRACWIFCALMILRLVFASGGVADFYTQRNLLQDRVVELDRIKKENMQIVREIERMQTDAAFQKKLVRDNLGFIASDEFLVLFPKEKLVQ